MRVQLPRQLLGRQHLLGQAVLESSSARAAPTCSSHAGQVNPPAQVNPPQPRQVSGPKLNQTSRAAAMVRDQLHWQHLPSTSPAVAQLTREQSAAQQANPQEAPAPGVPPPPPAGSAAAPPHSCCSAGPARCGPRGTAAKPTCERAAGGSTRSDERPLAMPGGVHERRRIAQNWP